MIKIVKHVIVIYTNYITNSFITRQTKLINNNVDKLNIKLIRAFVSLSQFRLNVRYKLNKFHIIFDALNHFFIDNQMFNDIKNVFDIENFYNNTINFENNFIYVWNNELIIISLEFKQTLQIDYETNEIWMRILNMLKTLNARVIKKMKSIKSIKTKNKR